MNDDNPYQAPKTSIEQLPSGEVVPEIWNPNAAANWSLPFSPIFGAILHMKNWQALGEPAKAAASRNWAIASAVIAIATVIVDVIMADDKAIEGITRILNFALLLAWYFASARAQAQYVKERFGKNYPRKGWGKPLLFALLAVFAFLVFAFIVCVVLAAWFMPAERLH